jgi:cobyrinic acid a,c-diamide synthase
MKRGEVAGHEAHYSRVNEVKKKKDAAYNTLNEGKKEFDYIKEKLQILVNFPLINSKMNAQIIGRT